MKIRSRSTSGLVNQLFLWGYFSFTVNQVFAESQFNEIPGIQVGLKLVRWALIPFFTFIIIMRDRYTFNKRVRLTAVLAIAAITNMLLFHGRILVVILVLIMIASYGCSVEKILKTHICGIVIGYLSVVAAVMAGILEDRASVKALNNLDMFFLPSAGIRHTMGFLVPNEIPIALLFVYLMLVLLMGDRFKKRYHIPFLFANGIVYYFCASRSVCLLVITVAVVHCFAVRKKKRFLQLGVLASKGAILLFLITSVVFPAIANLENVYVEKLNILLTARISIMQKALERYPLTVGGYGDTFVSIRDINDYLVLDNGYIYLFVTRGIALGILILLVWWGLINIARKQKNVYLLLAVFIILAENCIDSSFLLYKAFPMYCVFVNYGVRQCSLEKITDRRRLSVCRKGVQHLIF